MRYIEDGTGSKAATKTAPTLLTLAAVVQEMASEMSGRKMSYSMQLAIGSALTTFGAATLCEVLIAS